MFRGGGGAGGGRAGETMSMPVTSRTIVLDAGHGGEDGGAVSSNGIS